MKLQFASDFQREFGYSPKLPDVLVLVGNIGYADDETIEWIRHINNDLRIDSV